MVGIGGAFGFFQCNSTFSPQPCSVSEIVTDSGSWNWDLFSNLLPIEVVQQIVAVQPPVAQLGADSIGWRWEMNRCFSTKSAYAALTGGSLQPAAIDWNAESRSLNWVYGVYFAAFRSDSTLASRYSRDRVISLFSVL
ncbi:hypothetical protein V6N13_129933 [Hibiscus sabdariffa]